MFEEEIEYNKNYRRHCKISFEIENKKGEEMKRVLHISASENMGGIETFILNMCSHMNKDKYNFTVAAACEKALIENEIEKIGGNIVHISSIDNNKFEYAKGLWKTIKDKKYDIIHIHKNSLSNPLPIIFAKISRKKIVLHSHNTNPTSENASRMVHSVFKHLVSFFKIKRLACSKMAAEWMFGKNYKKKNVLLLNNGVDSDKLKFNKEIRYKIRNDFKIKNNEYAVCNVGRLSEQKNTLFILDIFERIYCEHNNSHLYLIGNGELESEAKVKASKLKSSSNIHFLGIRKDVLDIYHGMDLFLMPSLHEGLPIAAIEAQASGLPLLISDTVDLDVKICDSTEFEKLSSDKDIWAEHAIKLIEKNERKDTTEIIKKAGYDVNISADILEEIYDNL